MTNDDAKKVESNDEGESCGASLEQHIVDVWVGLTTVGLGNCREVYRALLEVAEAVRQQGKFNAYVPQGGTLVQDTVQAALKKAQAEMARRKAASDAVKEKLPSADFIFPDNLPKN